MNKVWFITGSSRGFGRALTEAVLADGDSVVATARRPEQLDDLVACHGARIRAVKLDVTSPVDAEKALASALEAYGRIEVLVNNAGNGFVGAFEEIAPEDFAGQLATNFWGVVNVTRAALPVLRRQGKGHVIQTTSIGGRIAAPGLSGYHAAKFAVEGLNETLAQPRGAFFLQGEGGSIGQPCPKLGCLLPSPVCWSPCEAPPAGATAD